MSWILRVPRWPFFNDFYFAKKKKEMFWKDSRDFIKVSKWRIGQKKINH